MLAFYLLLFFLFSLNLSFDIVPVTNLKNLNINIDKKYGDIILSFAHSKISESSNYSVIIRMNCELCKLFLYVYDD